MNSHDLPGKESYADDLTWREQDILILLADRLTNREIANHLHLALSTVKDYVSKILGKLYVKNRREAVTRAKALGLLDDGKKTEIRQPTDLPIEPTLFIGRRDELGEIRRHLKETRLLTLTGPGGIGKTRLALKAAKEAAGDFRDGCFFVSLAPIRSIENILQTIAEGLKFPIATHEDPTHQLLRYLRKKQLLLVMDNFEHLLDGVSIISEILRAAPTVKILATSRERLNLQSETNLNIGGMDVPKQVAVENLLNYDAIALFLQSARKVRPGFDPSPTELGQIAEICQIVRGMPLAIELSAAWLHILNVCEIIEELEKGIDILSTEVRDTPLRHRSIRAVFDHSWSMLHPTEQKILMMFSVFRGGFTREAAQKVTGASLQKLAGLSNKSFLSHDANSGRLEVHELLRQYGREQLDNSTEDSASAQEAHAAYYAEFIQERWQHLQDRRQMLAHAEIETDIENVRVAWQYYLGQRNVSQMWKLIFGLWQVYWIHGWNLAGKELFSEAVRVLQSEDKDENTHLKALAQALQAYFLAWLGQAEQGYELANESVAVLRKLDHPKALCCAYESLILNSYFLNRIVEETEAKNNFHEIALKIDDKRFLTLSFFVASMVSLIKEDFTEAGQLAESGLDITKETGDLINSTFPLIAWGHVAFARGNYEDARNYFERCLKVSEEVGFRWAIANSRKYLSKVALLMDNTAEAEKHLIQSLRITKEIGFVRDVVNILYDYACLCVAQGFPEQAVELLVLVSQHPTSPQFRWLEGRIRDSAQNLLGNLENELSLETFAIAVERGQKLVMDEVIADLIGSKGRK